MIETRVAAIIVAGGSGERLARPGGKQLLPVAGMPVLSWSLRAFDCAPEVDVIVVVCHPERVDEYRRVAVNPLEPQTPVVFAPGGETRQESVANGLAFVPDAAEIVLVHDGARPLVTPDTHRRYDRGAACRRPMPLASSSAIRRSTR